MEYKNDLQERIFLFCVRTLKLMKKIPENPENQTIRFQLNKSATSIGANYQESQAGISRTDFRNKIKIALKESRETHFWIRLLAEINSQIEKDEMSFLLSESRQLMLILGSIVNKLENRPVNK